MRLSTKVLHVPCQASLPIAQLVECREDIGGQGAPASGSRPILVPRHGALRSGSRRTAGPHRSALSLARPFELGIEPCRLVRFGVPLSEGIRLEALNHSRPLSGRPPEAPPSEEMKVEVRNRVLRVLAHVEHEPVAPLGNSLTLRHPLGQL